MKWYESHGFIEDPFSTASGMFIDKSVNLQGPAEELAYNIEAGNMVVIEGAKGTGKTTLLHAAIDKFKGERRVVYLDCSKSDADIKKLMQGRYGILGRLFSITPKNMVLLLDNFSRLPKRDVERAKFYFDNNYIRSIVFAGNAAELPENVLDRVGNRVLRLKPLSAKDAAELVKNRLGSLDFLPEKIIVKIYRKSKGDARKFLEMCSKACESATKSGASKVADEHLGSGGKNG